MSIDIKTLFYLFAGGNLFIVAFFSAYMFLNKVKNPFINIFIVSKTLYVILYILFALRTDIPDFYSVALANLFFIFALFYELYSISYSNLPFSRKQFIRLNFLIVFLSTILLFFVSASENIRVIVASATVTIVYTVFGVYLLVEKYKTKVQQITGYFCLILSLLFITRTIWAAFIDRSLVLYTNNHIQVVSYIFMFLVSFSMSIILLLILKEQNDDELRLSEERFHSIFEQPAVGVVQADFETGRFTKVNQKFLGIVGYSEEELFKLSFRDITHPDDLEDDLENLRSVTHGEASFFSMEKRYIRKDGSIVWTKITVYLMYNYQVSTNYLIAVIEDISKQKQIETSLKESEKKYRSVLEDQTEIISRFKTDGTFVFVSDLFCRFFGKSRNELIGQKWFPSAHPDDLELIENQLKTMSVQNPVVTIENRVYSGTGELHWMQFVNRGFYNKEGQLLETQSVGRDITDRKQIEEALRESEVKFSKTFYGNPNPTFITSLPDGVVIEINPMIEKLTGYRRDEIIGKKTLETNIYLRPEDREELFRQLEKDGRLQNYELSIRIKSGEIRHCRVFSEIIEIKGEPCLLTMMHDDTDRALAEKELYLSEERFCVLYNNSPDMYVSVSPEDASIVFCNQTLLNNTGYKKEEIIGTPIFNMYHEDCMEEVKKAFQQFIKTGIVKDKELTLKRKDGSTLDVSLNSNPVRDKEGKLLYSISSWRDITTRKLAREALIKSETQLKEALASKDKFFSIIAHDLRGPLGTLCQIGELLIDHPDASEAEKDVIFRSIYDGSKHTYDLLDNLIKWARSNSGMMVYKPIELNLNQIINDNINILNTKAQIKDIQITNSLEENLFVHADHDMLNSIVRNLISNSIKFTDRQGKIDIISIPEENTVCTFGIIDNGIGMSEETVSKVLDLDSTYTSFGTEQEKGFGLGLKLCKEFVIKNKGKIWAESEEDKGTQFWVSLPSSNKNTKTNSL